MTEKKLDVLPKESKKSAKKPSVPSSKAISKPKAKPKTKTAAKPKAKPKEQAIKIKEKKIKESVALLGDKTMTVVLDDIEPEFDQVLLDALTQRWAYIELRVINPQLPEFDPAQIILPALLSDSNSEFEFVYAIHDRGFLLSTSKAEDFVTAGMSMHKLYLTIEKMIFILNERLRSEGIDDNTQVDIALYGNELAMRKAFESIIHLEANVVVSNFDPGSWGNSYVQRVQKMIERGLGEPEVAPRDSYRKKYSESLKPRVGVR